MSKYLCFGIAKQVIAKTTSKWEKFSEEEIKNVFFKTVEQDLYTVTLDDDRKYVYFDLKDDMLAKYAIDLKKEQYTKYIRSEDLEEEIAYYDIINSKNERERLELINIENGPYLFNFKLGWYGFDAVSLFEKIYQLKEATKWQE